MQYDTDIFSLMYYILSSIYEGHDISEISNDIENKTEFANALGECAVRGYITGVVANKNALGNYICEIVNRSSNPLKITESGLNFIKR